MKQKASVLLVLISLAAIVSGGEAIRMKLAEVEKDRTVVNAAQPEDFYYDNPWIPPWVKDITAPWVPYLGPIGFPPATPSAPVNAGCSPFLPPILCRSYGSGGSPPAAPSPPAAHAAPSPPAAHAAPSPPKAPAPPKA